MRKYSPFFLSALLILHLHNLSLAEFVTQSFIGQVTAIRVGGQNGPPAVTPIDGILVGSPFSASFSFDTLTGPSDSNPDNSQGQYLLPANVNNRITVDFGSGRIFQKSPNSLMGIDTFNNVLSTMSPTTDLLSLSGIAQLPPGWNISSGDSTVRLTFANFLGTALPNDALPTSFPNAWSSLLFTQNFTGNVITPSGTFSQLYIEGTMLAVPEPTSVAPWAVAIVYWLSRKRPIAGRC